MASSGQKSEENKQKEQQAEEFVLAGKGEEANGNKLEAKLKNSSQAARVAARYEEEKIRRMLRQVLVYVGVKETESERKRLEL